MMQYNLRLDEQTKEKAKVIAKKKGLSENSLYQIAIEEFIVKSEAADFYDKLLNRVVSPQRLKSIIEKLSKNSGEVLFKEDL